MFVLVCLQAVVYPLAELTQAEDVAAPKHSGANTHQQTSQPAADISEAAAEQTAEGADAEADAGAVVCAQSMAHDDSSDPAAVLRSVQQHMVHLTMLLCSRNLWMRPAVLEAPAQDPQYLEAIHKVWASTLGCVLQYICCYRGSCALRTVMQAWA